MGPEAKLSAFLGFQSSRFSGAQEMFQERRGKRRFVASTRSLRDRPERSHSVSTKALNDEPVWKPLEPPYASSVFQFTRVSRGDSGVAFP